MKSCWYCSITWAIQPAARLTAKSPPATGPRSPSALHKTTSAASRLMAPS
jgi:hypothetical protein